MAAALITAQTRLPYPAAELARLVADVESYPGFIPWITSIRLTEQRAVPGGWEGAATAEVGWRAISERFSTTVRCLPEAGQVDVDLISGPFKSLQNRWRFLPQTDGSTLVRCAISYEFRNPMLQALAAAQRHRASAKIIHAFEKEAHRRFAATAGA